MNPTTREDRLMKKLNSQDFPITSSDVCRTFEAISKGAMQYAGALQHDSQLRELAFQVFIATGELRKVTDRYGHVVDYAATGKPTVGKVRGIDIASILESELWASGAEGCANFGQQEHLVKLRNANPEAFDLTWRLLLATGALVAVSHPISGTDHRISSTLVHKDHVDAFKAWKFPAKAASPAQNLGLTPAEEAEVLEIIRRRTQQRPSSP